MGVATAPAGAHDDRLKRNAIGLPSAMAMSLAFISPTIGVIFISALIANQAGASAPFAFIIGTIGVLLMANTLAEFTKRVPSAGTFYTFAGAGRRTLRRLHRRLAAVPDLRVPEPDQHEPVRVLRPAGPVARLRHRPHRLLVGLRASRIIAFVAWLGYESIKYSLRLDIIFVAFEVLVMAILLIYIVVTGGAEGQSPQSFTPALAPGPAATHAACRASGMAFIFILFAFFGFESSTTVAEECENPQAEHPDRAARLGRPDRPVVHLRPVRGRRRLRPERRGHRQARRRPGPARHAGPAVPRRRLRRVHRHRRADGERRRADRDPQRQLPHLLRDGPRGRPPELAGQDAPDPQDPVPGDLRLQRLRAVLTIGDRAALGPPGRLRQQRLLLEPRHPADLHRGQHPAGHVHVAASYRDEFSWWRHGLLPILGAIMFTAALWFSVVPLPAAPLSVLPGRHRRLGGHRPGHDGLHPEAEPAPARHHRQDDVRRGRRGVRGRARGASGLGEEIEVHTGA